MNNYYSIVSSLRTLCIENKWFNAGTNEQYEKVFEFAKELVKKVTEYALNGNSNFYLDIAIARLTDVIWICTYGVDKSQISREIEIWFNQCIMKEVTSKRVNY